MVKKVNDSSIKTKSLPIKVLSGGTVWKIEKQLQPVITADKEIKRIFANKREEGKRIL